MICKVNHRLIRYHSDRLCRVESTSTPNRSLAVKNKIFSNDELIPFNWRADSENGHVWCFNPGLTRVNDQWLMVYRVVLSDQKRRLALCLLDNDLQVIRGSVIGISDHIEFGPKADYTEHVKNWFADPRIYWLAGKLFIYFNSGWHDPINHQFLCELDPKSLAPVTVARELILQGTRQKIEKNWMLFGTDPYFAVYSVSPHCVLQLDLKAEGDIRCERVSHIAWSGHEHPSVSNLRGGAPPQFLNGHFYSFCHFTQANSMGAEYHVAVYTFSAAFPFRPTRAPIHRLTLGGSAVGRKSRPRLNPAVSEVIYPCGAVLHEGLWVISYGINDESCAVSALSRETVDQTMSVL